MSNTADIFTRNIRKIMYENNKTQADLCRDLKLSSATVSTWVNGDRMPRMNKIDMLCDYFKCSRSDLIDEQKPIDVNNEVKATDDFTFTIVTESTKLKPEQKKHLLNYIELLLKE